MDARTAHVQDLRRSGAAQPIPPRKPTRRGGRGGQRRDAIRREQHAHR